MISHLCTRQTLSAVHSQGLTLLQVLQSHPDIRAGATEELCQVFILILILLFFKVWEFLWCWADQAGNNGEEIMFAFSISSLNVLERDTFPMSLEELMSAGGRNGPPGLWHQ